MRTAAALALALAALPAPAADPYVPPELDPWVGWVLNESDPRACPWVAGDAAGGRECAWPGELQLDVADGGAQFRQAWTLYAEAWVPLPGGADAWPGEVVAGGRAVPVSADAAGLPRVRLGAGRHALAGRLSWNEPPAAVALPAGTALVALTVAGRPVARPRLEQGRLLLSARPAAAGLPEDSLRVEVWRQIRDGLPAILQTRVRLAVGGRPREALLGRILPDGFVPMALDAPLPARIEPDGRLRMQLAPGNWMVSLEARAARPQDRFAAPGPDGTWAAHETWSVDYDPELRVVVPRARTPVDPGRAGVPEEWRGLPAFRLEPGESLELEERGGQVADRRSNRLALQRELWLDFDGESLTAVDRLSGELVDDWRLDMAEPWVLASAAAGEEPLLVTAGREDGWRGVEWRGTRVDLSAMARVAADGTLPAAGWTVDLAGIETVLNLPPSWRLIAAPGADASPDDWLARWSLADAFLALLAAVAAARLLGWRWGIAAAVLLALTWQEPGAPRWAWLATIAAFALARHAPEGRLRRVARGAHGLALAVLILIALPFAGQQLTAALYPQLDPVQRGRYPVAPPAVSVQEFSLRKAGPQRTADEAVADAVRAAAAPVVTARPAAAEGPVQAGPGVPGWRHRSYRLSLGGPVAPAEELRLVLVSPAWLSALRVLAVALLAALGWQLGRGFRRPSSGAPALAGILAAAVLAPALLVPAPAEAEIPPAEILRELETRLRAPPDCAPDCARLASLRLEARAGRLAMMFEVHAQARTAARLPGSPGGWRPQAVRVDGEPATVREPGQPGGLLVDLAAGIHRVEFEGSLPDGEAVTLFFPERPASVEWVLEGWETGGFPDAAHADVVLELRPRAGPGEARPALQPAEIPPFVRVHRRLSLAREWTVHTEVSRAAPASGAFTVELPLLPGESIVGWTGERTAEGSVRLGFGQGTGVVVVDSTLPTGRPVTLQAPADLSREETWEVRPGPGWRPAFEGLMPAVVQPDAARVFRPRPGERLVVSAVAPEAVPGPTLAFDRVHLQARFGRRGSDGELGLSYRSTAGGSHGLALPEALGVTSVAIDGIEQALRPADGELRLPVAPGRHEVLVRWEDSREPGLALSTPEIGLGAPAANLHLRVEPGPGRWILATAGPGRGPAVLYWSELAVFLVLAVLLARYAPTPLRGRDWLLLGLGFSTFSWGVLLLLGVWLFAIAARERWPAPSRDWTFNLVQAGLLALTVLTLGAVGRAVPGALLGSPRMHVAGEGSHGGLLAWFLDAAEGSLPAATAWTLPLWAWQIVMLAWALWLVFALVRWLRWAWRTWTRDGTFRGRITLPRRPPRSNL